MIGATAHQTTADAATPLESSDDHLWLALSWVETLVRAETARWRQTIAHTKNPQLWGMVHVTDDEVDRVLGAPFVAPDQLTAQVEAELVPFWRAAETRLRELSEREGLTPDHVELRLRSLSLRFQLSLPEVASILCCVLPELDGRYRRLYGYLQDDASRQATSIELLQHFIEPLTSGPAERRVLFDPGSRLFENRLLLPTSDPRQPQPTRLVRVDDRVVSYLLGDDTLDAGLRGCASVVPASRLPVACCLPPTWLERLDVLVKRLSSSAAPENVLLCGKDGSGRCAIARHLASAREEPLLAFDVGVALQNHGQSFPELLALALREATLLGATLLCERFEVLLDDTRRPSLAEFTRRTETFRGLLVCSGSSVCRQTPAASAKRWLRLDLPDPDYGVRRAAWMHQIDSVLCGRIDVPDIAGLSALLANGFQLTPGKIVDASECALDLAASRDASVPAPHVTLEDLFEGCRRQSGRLLAGLARLVQPGSSLRFDDLVLPAANRRQLDELRTRIRHRSRVLIDMGFEARMNLGRGLVALFTGSSGTGKTMTAELLGRENGMQLYKVDLSAVVSKYVGETEKNLARVFDEAEGSNAILFFDEGEALFGRRGEVKEAKDRWANLEVNYLLQRVEEYSGVVVLTTNFRQNMDPAFLRRIQVTVEFPRPDADARFRIMKGMFPPGVSRPADEELRQLANRFNLSGGNIKNAVLDAAYRALATGSDVITYRHLVLGIAREQQKLGNALTKGDFGEEAHAWVRAEIL